MKIKRLINEPRLFFTIAAALLCLVVASPLTVMAQEGDDETSYFNNAAQAAKAQNLADISAEMAEENTEAQDALGTAQGEFDDAESALKDLIESEDDTINFDNLTDEEAQKLIDEYVDDAANKDKTEVQDYLGAQKNLDQALADATGATVADIAAMRASGMGWGQIAHELGIHPSVLGNRYGHQNQNQIRNQNRNRNKEMASYGYGKKTGTMSSTMRDLKTGGNAYGKSKSNQGQGKGADKAGGIGKANGQDQGGKGNSGGKGNNGKGNDKD